MEYAVSPRLTIAVTQRILLLHGLILPLPEYVLQKAIPRSVRVTPTNIGLYVETHAPNVTNARPKLASTILICQRNALRKADEIALPFRKEHFISNPYDLSKVLNALHYVVCRASKTSL